MNYPYLKPLLLLGTVFILISLACGAPTPTAEAPAEVKPAEPVQQAEPEQAQPVTSGAVSNLQDVRGAVIQIEAQGTFVDPEYGEFVGGGSGSGFIIDPSGIAVTNNHVVTGAATLTVYIGGDTTKAYNAQILGVSECSDLAVIDIEGDGFSYLDWYSDPINVGLEIYTAGFPLGEPEYTLTKGIVSKESTSGETDWASIESVIMHDATINPGNSGGPLITNDGEVVAVNYRGRGAQDQYFAIGRDVAVPIIDKLRSGQDVDSIGINGNAVIWGDSGEYSGVWVSSVASGSPADKTGITGGDIVTSLEGTPLGADGTLSDYCKVIRTHGATGTISVEVLRFSTSEILEGQLNGTPLAVTFSGGDSGTTSDSGTGDVSTGDASGDAPAYYVEEFEPGSTTVDYWYWFLQQGNENLFDIYTDNGKLVFEINGNDIYSYFAYDPWVYTNVRVDARAENRGKNNNNVSLICRGDDRGWYEFSIANNGLWWIWAFENGEYTMLANGGSNEVNMGRGVNDYTIMCYENTLSLYINGVHTHTLEENKFVFREGQVAIGVSSFDALPIIVEFDWVAINENMQ